MALPGRHLIALLLGIGCTAFAAAQGAPPARTTGPDNTTDRVRARFSVMLLGPAIRDRIYFDSANNTRTEVRLPRSSRSPLYTFVGRNPLTLYREEPGTEPGRFLKVPVGEIRFDGDARQWMVFLAPAEASTGTGPSLRAFLTDDRIETAPANSVRLVNFTDTTYFGRFGTTDVSLPPGIGPIVRLPVQAADLPFGIAAPFGAQWRPILESRVELARGDRLIGIILPPHPASTERISFRFVRDSVPVDPTATPAGSTPRRSR